MLSGGPPISQPQAGVKISYPLVDGSWKPVAMGERFDLSSAIGLAERNLVIHTIQDRETYLNIKGYTHPGCPTKCITYSRNGPPKQCRVCHENEHVKRLSRSRRWLRNLHWLFTGAGLLVDAYNYYMKGFAGLAIWVLTGIMYLASQTDSPSTSGLSLVASIDPFEFGKRVIKILQNISSYFVMIIPVLFLLRLEWGYYQIVDDRQRYNRARFKKNEERMKAEDEHFTSRSYEYWSCGEEDVDVCTLNLHASGNKESYTRRCLRCINIKWLCTSCLGCVDGVGDWVLSVRKRFSCCRRRKSKVYSGAKMSNKKGESTGLLRGGKRGGDPREEEEEDSTEGGDEDAEV